MNFASQDLSRERRDDLKKLQGEILDYHFRDVSLLDLALTHKSFSHEQVQNCEIIVNHYEGLEFLGDSILGCIISEFLFRNYSDLTEGQLSKLKSHLVSTHRLSQLSSGLGLGQYLNLSRGEEKTGGREKKAILADLFESTIAAIYLDGGLEAARAFVLKQLESELEKISQGEIDYRDHKSVLQEKLHELGRSEPTYRVVGEKGPDHQKQFYVEVTSEDRVLAQGIGKSKKQAEQRAARSAISQFESESPPGSGEVIDSPGD